MSADLEAIVEVRRDGKWVLAEPARWGPKVYFGQVDETQQVLETVSLYLEQNYELFAILANVRNFRYEIQPIAACRGLPVDASEEARWVEREGEGWRSCETWLLAAELFDHDWSKTVATEEGMQTHAELATRSADPTTAPLFAEVFPKLRSYGQPHDVRILLFFY